MYPKSFSKPEGQPNEIWIGDWNVDRVDARVATFQTEGYTSARAGSIVTNGCRQIFADAIEAVKVDALRDSLRRPLVDEELFREDRDG
jgi:hypothetical protein